MGQSITANWDVFGALFKSEKAVTRIMANLNTLRGPIAHCTLLAEGEVRFKQLIERVLGRQVDLIDYGGLKTKLDDDIRRDAVLL